MPQPLWRNIHEALECGWARISGEAKFPTRLIATQDMRLFSLLHGLGQASLRSTPASQHQSTPGARVRRGRCGKIKGTRIIRASHNSSLAPFNLSSRFFQGNAQGYRALPNLSSQPPDISVNPASYTVPVPLASVEAPSRYHVEVWLRSAAKVLPLPLPMVGLSVGSTMTSFGRTDRCH